MSGCSAGQDAPPPIPSYSSLRNCRSSFTVHPALINEFSAELIVDKSQADIELQTSDGRFNAWNFGCGGFFHELVHTCVRDWRLQHTAVSENLFGLEDLRGLAPVLPVFGLPVSTPVDVGAFSC